MNPRRHYDAIVVGSGAGGGTIAGLLTEGGKRVLLLDAGRDAPLPGDVGRDYVRNQRLSLYGVNAGPDDLVGNPRVAVDTRGDTRVVHAHDGGYSHNAWIVGGGTRVYGGQAWRFHPLDFRMASEYGVPEGSSLADWPLSFEDLMPFYEKVEHQLGVSGDADAMHASHLPRYDKPYPMPPVTPDTGQGRTLRAGAAKLGWKTIPVPLAINSVPRGNRPACIHCTECPGFACPVDAKNGTHNTFIPRAMVTGRCDLVSNSRAYRVEHREGVATGVSYFGPDGNPYLAEADVVVLACGTIETARLLLLSGLENDNIGRNVQGHVYPGAIGRFEHEIYDGVGPGASTATADFCHHNPGVIGGGMIADDFLVLPVTYWKRYIPPHVPRYGKAAKDWMRDVYRRTLLVTGPVQEIPNPESRVALDPRVRDRYGIPVARISGTTHPETVKTAAFLHGKVREWLTASGAVEIWGSAPGQYFSGGQHQAGSCRMGSDPATSVTDRDCRVHGFSNLYLGDGSVHVTNGPFNPFLTIQALAYRTGTTILSRW